MNVSSKYKSWFSNVNTDNPHEKYVVGNSSIAAGITSLALLFVKLESPFHTGIPMSLCGFCSLAVSVMLPLWASLVLTD